MQAVASTSTLSTCWQCRLLATAAFAKRWQSTEAVSSLAPEPNYVPPPILSNPEISTSTRDRPSLQDLLALKPKRLRPPKPELPTTSSEFAVYTRRFNKAINAVSKAFQKDQIVSISQNDLNLKYKASRTSKLQVVRKIFTDYWNYPDPIQMAKLAREGGKSASVSKEASERNVAVTSLEAALFLRNGQESNHILNPLQTKYRVTIQVTGIGRSALRISGQSQDVADCVLAWEELRKRVAFETIELDTAKAGLRSDMYKTLSTLSNTYITSTSSKPHTLDVAYRSDAPENLSRLKALLQQLQYRHQVEQYTPEVVPTTYPEATYAMEPYCVRSQPSWMLSSLPLYGLQRMTTSEPVDDKQIWAGKSGRDALGALHAKPDETLTLEARFGHALQISANASNLAAMESETTPPTKSGDKQRIFLPGAPPGILNRFNVPIPRPSISDVRSYTDDLQTSSTLHRRVVYAADFDADDMKNRYLCVERAYESNDSPKGDDGLIWTGQAHREVAVNVLMPHRPVDVRMALVASQPIDPSVLRSLPIKSKAFMPATLQHLDTTYFLLDDVSLRKIHFHGGIGHWTESEGVEAILEKSKHRGVQSAGFLIRTRCGLDRLDSIIDAVQRCC